MNRLGRATSHPAAAIARGLAAAAIAAATSGCTLLNDFRDLPAGEIGDAGPTSSAQVVADGRAAPFAIGVDKAFVYWSETSAPSDGLIARLARTGESPPESFASTQAKVFSLAVLPSDVLWATSQRIVTGSKDSGKTTPLLTVNTQIMGFAATGAAMASIVVPEIPGITEWVHVQPLPPSVPARRVPF